MLVDVGVESLMNKAISLNPKPLNQKPSYEFPSGLLQDVEKVQAQSLELQFEGFATN